MPTSPTLSIRLAAVLLLSVLAAGPAVGQQAQKKPEKALSGRELLAGCEQGAVPGNPNQYCMRYVFGLVQTVVMVQHMDTSKQPLFCIDPAKTSLQEVTEAVTTWLKKSPERLDQEAYVLVSQALHQQYPCART